MISNHILINESTQTMMDKMRKGRRKRQTSGITHNDKTCIFQVGERVYNKLYISDSQYLRMFLSGQKCSLSLKMLET